MNLRRFRVERFRKPWIILRGVTLTFLGAATALISLSTSGWAQAGASSSLPSDCPTTYQRLAHPQYFGKGVKTGGEDVIDTAVSCARAVTIAVTSADLTAFVEIGWYEQNFDSTQVPSAKCPKTNGSPTLLIDALDGNTAKCKQSPLPNITEGYNAFNAQDTNGDGTWNFYWKGTYEGFYNEGTFVNGDPRSNGERESTVDLNGADHTGLQRLNSSGVWQDWSGDSEVIVQVDSGYKLCLYTGVPTHTAVKQNGQAC